MNRFSKIIAALALVSCFMVMSTACGNNTSSEAASSDNSSVAETTASSAETSAPDGSSVASESSDTASSKEEYKYVVDGKFTLPNRKLSFTLPEGYEFVSSTYVYQFTSEETENKFNFAVNSGLGNIEEVTEKEMTSTYETTMQDFKLIEFKHTEVAGKPAIYMQLTGKLYGIDSSPTVTQYMIQSGDDAYCFTFTQTDFYGAEFSTVIDSVISSLSLS